MNLRHKLKMMLQTGEQGIQATVTDQDWLSLTNAKKGKIKSLIVEGKAQQERDPEPSLWCGIETINGWLDEMNSGVASVSVKGGDHAGIPALYSVGSAKDTCDLISGDITRHTTLIEVQDVDAFAPHYSESDGILMLDFNKNIVGTPLCTHFKGVTFDTEESSLNTNEVTIVKGSGVSFGTTVMIKLDTTAFPNASSVRDFIAREYSADHPITFLCALDESGYYTEQTTPQPLRIDNGYNLLEVTNSPLDGIKMTAVYTATEQPQTTNIIVEAKANNVQIGDTLIFDTVDNTQKILKMHSYNAASFDALTAQNLNGRYVISDCLYYETYTDYGLFMHKKQVASATWAVQCEFKLSGLDLTQAGSFSFLSTGYQAAATATTIEWQANDSLDDIVAQFTTGNGGVIGNASYSSKTKDGDDIIFYVGGYGTNNITIANPTGGAANLTLTDYSKVCKIGDNLVADTSTHRSFQGKSVATNFPTIASELLPVTSTCYTVGGANRTYRCGVNFTTFRNYSATSGEASTFMDDTTASTKFPNTRAKFYSFATSETAAEVACYNRHRGSYNDYVKSAMADVDAQGGTVGNSNGNLGKQGKLLASIFYKDHNDEWKPCYPAAYRASLIESDASFTSRFGELYIHNSHDTVSCMIEKKRTILNSRITTLGGGNAIGSSILWAGDECDGVYAWVFYATNGILSIYNKVNTFGVRGSLAFRFQS